MRAIVVHPGPAWSTADVYRGWVRGLQANGVDVREFNLDDRLTFYDKAGMVTPFPDASKCAACGSDGVFEKWFDEPADVIRAVGHGLHAACYQYRPDVVVVVAGAFLPTYVYDIIRSHGSKVVVIHTESPYEDERQIDVAGHADLNLINDPANIGRFPAGTMFVPHAYDPKVHTPGPSDWDLDVAWVGTAGTTFPSRTRFMEAVNWGGATVGLAGLWQGLEPDSPLAPYVLHEMGECVNNDTTVDIYRGSRITFNLYRSDGIDGTFDGGWAMGPREVEACATGIFLARHSPADHGGEGDAVLPMLPTFTEPQELGDIVAHYLAHDDRRLELVGSARAAIADRTFENHAALMLRRLDTI